MPITIATDLDGTLYDDDPLHGRTGGVGVAIWNLVKGTGYMRRRLREMKPNALGLQLLREAHERGATIAAVTARDHSLAGVTRESLDAAGADWIRLFTRSPDQTDVVYHKASMLTMMGAAVFFDDDLALCEGIRRTLGPAGPGAPLIVHLTSWELAADVIAMVEQWACRS